MGEKLYQLAIFKAAGDWVFCEKHYSLVPISPRAKEVPAQHIVLGAFQDFALVVHPAIRVDFEHGTQTSYPIPSNASAVKSIIQRKNPITLGGG
jgi:hypothetical protein